jgi:hypothetical protein
MLYRVNRSGSLLSRRPGEAQKNVEAEGRGLEVERFLGLKKRDLTPIHRKKMQFYTAFSIFNNAPDTD